MFDDRAGTQVLKSMKQNIILLDSVSTKPNGIFSLLLLKLESAKRGKCPKFPKMLKCPKHNEKTYILSLLFVLLSSSIFVGSWIVVAVGILFPTACKYRNDSSLIYFISPVS